MIITTEGFYSFESSGDIKRLNLSKKYVPGYLEIERIQKEAQRIGEKRGRQEEKIEMAKKMKDKGTDVEFISEITGLSREEIERLK